MTPNHKSTPSSSAQRAPEHYTVPGPHCYVTNQDSLIVFMLNGWKLKKQRGISVQAQCGSIFLGSAEIAMGKAKAPVIKNCSTYKQQSVSMKGKGSSTGLKRPTKQPKWFHCYGITHLLRTLCKWQYWLYRYGGTCHWGSEDSLFRLTLHMLLPPASNEWMNFSFGYSLIPLGQERFVGVIFWSFFYPPFSLSESVPYLKN